MNDIRAHVAAALIALLVIDNEARLRAVLPTLRPMVAEDVSVLFDGDVKPLP